MATSTSYGQYCPLSRALDVLGERWSLMIIRDLYAGTSRFNDLARGLPGLSRGLLSRRLRQLEAAGVVDHVDGHYRLSPAGRDLEPVLFGLGTWGARWAFGDPVPAELDPDLLVWWMRDRIDTSPWPGERHVIHIAFTDDKRQYWIVVERGEAFRMPHRPRLRRRRRPADGRLDALSGVARSARPRGRPACSPSRRHRTPGICPRPFARPATQPHGGRGAGRTARPEAVRTGAARTTPASG